MPELKHIFVDRTWGDTNQTLGNFKVVDPKGKPLFACLSLERGWRDNKRMESCVLEGTFKIVWEWSPAFKCYLWELKGVTDRSESKVHPANYWFDLNGCIGLGRALKDMNGDGYLDLTASRDTVNAFHRAMGDDKEALITIKNFF